MPDPINEKEKKMCVDIGCTTGDVTKSWYSLEGARMPVNIRYIHWAEDTSQPMKDSLFLDYIMKRYLHVVLRVHSRWLKDSIFFKNKHFIIQEV